MNNTFGETFLLTIQLALVTTVILVVIGIPIAYLLYSRQWKITPFLEAIISLPLVLPPTVIGFYLLLAFSPESAFGAWLLNTFDIKLVFTFGGLVVGSIIYSLPFMVQPIQSGFDNLSPHLAEASYTLGKSEWQTLFQVLLPNIRPSLLSGIVLSFAHTIGEFGVVLMIGGNIPGKTKVASIAIYDEVESLNYAAANSYALLLLIFSFLILSVVYFINRQRRKANLL